MAKSGNFGHLLFYGPPGGGKKTRINAFLTEVYGDGAQKVRVDQKTFKLPNTSSTTVELYTVSSAHHIEINPSDAGNHDRHIVQEVIKQIAQTPPIDSVNSTNPKSRDFRILVLHEVDKLTSEAQSALRRTMEKYSSVCRLILCCNSTSKVLEPIRSRCLGVRIPLPSESEIVPILTSISTKEGFTLDPTVAAKFAKASDRNLRRAILMLEATKSSNANFAKDKNPTIQIPDWETYITQMADKILDEQSPRRLAEIRNMLYELLGHVIPPEVVLKKLTMHLIKKLDSEVKTEVIKWAAFYDHRLQIGTKAIFHLEAFVAKFMSIYKRFLINSTNF